MSDWASEAADRVEQVGDLLRDKVVVPARRGAVAVVWGILAASFVVVGVVIALITLFRVLTYIPPGTAWFAYLLLAGICLILGVFCWSKRGPRLDTTSSDA